MLCQAYSFHRSQRQTVARAVLLNLCRIYRGQPVAMANDRYILVLVFFIHSVRINRSSLVGRKLYVLSDVLVLVFEEHRQHKIVSICLAILIPPVLTKS